MQKNAKLQETRTHFNFRRSSIIRPADLALLQHLQAILVKNLLQKQDLRKGTPASESFPVATQEMCSDNQTQQFNKTVRLQTRR